MFRLEEAFEQIPAHGEGSIGIKLLGKDAVIAQALVSKAQGKADGCFVILSPSRRTPGPFKIWLHTDWKSEVRTAKIYLIHE